ncbi:hypothetical protein MUN88_19155 [Gracilibacillus caseinilyticus]|uniref:Uncharacterized protein n=1 Tax=Gracilibacillus caseinilyticus TaxID=2932256 RepID=A0ABY4EW99_9BACI|nr:hypothetical protein [Gracilibacillus caseinilyticus]UOQ48138.1 hypothetical protein MUN88_19155 [Gracilibacillus caseinilyticus]
MQLRQLNNYLHRLKAIETEITSVRIKNRKLADFMNELESTQEYAENNPHLMHVYKQASNARVF